MLRVMWFALMVSIFVLALVIISDGTAALIGYWPLDKGNGNNVMDASGNGHDGTFVGNPQWVEGVFGQAVEFDGSSSYIEVPHADSLSPTTDMTLACWFKPSVLIGAGNNYRLMSKNNDIFFLFNYEQIGPLGFLVKDAGGTNHVVHSTTAEWNEGEWYHVAGTFDGTELGIYINGVSEAVAAFAGVAGTSGLDLWIGADDLPAYFPGTIDEVRFYDEVLSEEEISQIMDEGAAVEPGANKLATTWAALK